jgi:anti-sigma-K factor RskA
METNDHDLLIRLDEKVDGLHRKIDTLTDDHEVRIRSLERWRWIVVGMSAIVASVITWASTFFHKV